MSRTINHTEFPVYLDYSSTTPMDPLVVDTMIPYMREQFGNPASRSHAYGWSAETAVENARNQVAELVGADPREIVWTSGATESNNLAIKGVAQALQQGLVDQRVDQHPRAGRAGGPGQRHGRHVQQRRAGQGRRPGLG